MKTELVIVTSHDEFAALAGAWDELVDGIEGTTAFQSHACLSAWWRRFGNDRPPLLLCARQGSRLAGALALQRIGHRLLGRPIGTLELLGMPDEILRPVFLVHPGETQVLEFLLAALGALPDRQVVQLDEVPRNAWFLNALAAWSARTGLRCWVDRFHGCPYLVKAGDWDAFLAEKPRRFASRLRQTENRLRRAGRVRFESMQSPEEGAAFVECFRTVEARSWKAGNVAAVGHDPRYAGFYRDLLGGPGSGIRGHALVLRVDDRPIAATLGFSRSGAYHALQIAHDREWDRHSPGLLLEAQEMRWFFGNESLQRYEFLGGENFSKRRWTARAVATLRVTIHAARPVASLYVFGERFVSPLRESLEDRLRGKRGAEVEPFQYD